MTYAHAHAHAHTSTHTITSSTLKEITNTCTHNLRMKLLEDTNSHVRQHIGRHATRKAENAKTQTQGKRGVRKKYEDEKRCSDCCSCCLCCCSKIILLLGFSISRRAWVHVQPALKHTAWTVAQLPTTIELMKPRRPSLRSFFSTASPFSSPNHETAWRRSPTKTSRPCRTR